MDCADRLGVARIGVCVRLCREGACTKRQCNESCRDEKERETSHGVVRVSLTLRRYTCNRKVLR